MVALAAPGVEDADVEAELARVGEARRGGRAEHRRRQQAAGTGERRELLAEQLDPSTLDERDAEQRLVGAVERLAGGAEQAAVAGGDGGDVHAPRP